MTADIAVEALSLTLGAFHLDKIDFALARGEILVLLGPNGAGKSVTLETIAGFHRLEHGRVRIGGRDVTLLPPEQRKIGFVVQNFGLFPHLDVEANVAIARRRDRGGGGSPAPPLQGDTAALLKYFGVTHLARRRPADLSPGEKQRVALARAVAGAPDLFLFDEPFSALDAQTRTELRDELKSFLRALAIPAIFVTHDYAEARMLADTIMVLRGGAVLQRGPAAEVFQRPASSAVARLVGVENILDGRIAEIGEAIAAVAVGDRLFRAPAPAHSTGAGTAVRLGIRAEDVTIAAPADARAPAPDPERNRLDGKITGLHALGPLVTIEIDAGFPLKAYLLGPQARAMKLGVGDSVTAEIATDAIHLMTG
ncbi:MAG: ABC transporter ATP-binding protein [Xanthobacteraceae bacterium]